jgi:hypothetical protein
MTEIDLTKVPKEKLISTIKKVLENNEEVDFIVNDELACYMDFIVELLKGKKGILRKNHYIFKSEGGIKCR